MKTVKRCFKSLLLVGFFLSVIGTGMAENLVYRIPDLTIDAARAGYRSLISGPQDDISSLTIKLKTERNPIKILHSFNPSIVFGGGLRGATVTPSYRGFDSKHMAVMLDGCSVNTGWNSTSPISGFPTSRIQRATVVSGGNGLVYGAGSVAGTVNFVLPTARDLEGLTIVQEMGGEGRRHQELIYGHVSAKSEHLFSLFIDEQYGKRRFKDFSNAAVDGDNLGTMDNSSDNRAFLYKGQQELNDDLTLRVTILENHGRISCPAYFEKFKPWEMSLYDYSLVKYFNDTDSLTLRYAKYRDFSSTWSYPGDRSMTNGTLNVGGDVEVNIDTVELLYNFEADRKNFITLGAITQKLKDTGHGFISGNEKKVDTTGIFVSDAIKATDHLDLQLSARSDKGYEGDNQMSWSFNSRYALTEATEVGFSSSRVVRNPNMQELYRGKGMGNPDLKAEEADNLELRLGHKFNDKINASLTWFGAEIANYISTDAAGQYQNLAKVEINGLEFHLQAEIAKHFTGWCGYTDFTKARNKTDGTRLKDRPKCRAVAGLGYERNKLNVSLIMSHQGVSKAIDATYPEVPASTIFDLNLRKQATKDFAIYLAVTNLADKKDVQLNQATGKAAYSKGVLNLNQSQPIYYEPGRIISLGMELKL